MRRIALLTLVATGVLLASVVSAATDYEVIPVQSIRNKDRAVEVSFSLPCGNSFEGFLFRWDGPQHLRIGVVTSVEEVLCAGFPQVVTRVIRSLDTDRLSSVTAIEEVDVRDSYKLISPLDIRHLGPRPLGKLARIQMVYETRCGLFEGFVYRETSNGEVEIAVAERLSREAGDVACSFRQEVVSMTAPRSVEGAENRVQPIALNKANLQKAFELSLAPILSSSLKSDRKAGIQFEYTRNCRQAPVGVVLSSPKGSKERPVVVVGMVVAEFYNIDCDVKALPVREQFHDVALQLPAEYLVEVYASDIVEDFALKQPTQYATESQAEASFDYLQGCGKVFGAVYNRDKNGDLAVGILETIAAVDCRRPAREITLPQPYLTQRGLQTVIFPMKIKGTRSIN